MIKSPGQTRLLAFLFCTRARSPPVPDSKLDLQSPVIGYDTADLLLPLSTSHLTSGFTPSIRLLPDSTRFYLIPLFLPLMDICTVMVTPDPVYARRPSRQSPIVRTRRPPPCPLIPVAISLSFSFLQHFSLYHLTSGTNRYPSFV
ncbi:hypothetical protein K439DRAFT_419170 [Ramaria rubella]|nr:hypothetical protein K439DRAFT_419170 [Ramaria rubella]